MNQLRSRAGLRLLALAVALLVVALVGVACAPAAPAAPAATAAPAPSPASAPATTAPVQTAAPQAPAGKLDLPVGVDADGNFYRGDPKAAVKLVEYSDFQ